MKREYTHTPLEVAEGILSGKYAITSVYALVNQIEDLARERDEARAEVARMREALRDIERGDYSDPMCERAPEQRAREALEAKP